MNRTAKLVFLPITCLLFLFFLFVARHRFIQGDEGFYLLASRLVLMHKRPYLDFFYDHLPLVPYVYALWFKFSGVSWNSARLLSVLSTTALGALIYRHICKQTNSWLAGVLAVVLFASSTLIFACFTIAGNYVLAALFVFSSYVVLSEWSGSSSKWTPAASGMLLGLSALSRVYTLLLIPAFLWRIFQQSDTRTKLQSALWFLAGFAIVVSPCLYFFISSPDVFLFNVLRYHGMRWSSGWTGGWGDRLLVLLECFLGGPEGNGLQFSILFFVSLGFVYSTLPRESAPRFSFQMAIVLGLISMLPNPVSTGYFSLCVPFLIVSAVCAVHALFQPLDSGRQKLIAAIATSALLAVYVAVAVGDLRKYLVTGDGIASVRFSRDKNDWTIRRASEVSRAIDQVAGPGEMVLSLWPGYLFQTQAHPFPGFENDYTYYISEKLSPAQRARYHAVSPGDMEGNFSRHVPCTVVLGNENHLLKTFAGDSMENSLRVHGYTLVRVIGDTSVYSCRSKAPKLLNSVQKADHQ